MIERVTFAEWKGNRCVLLSVSGYLATIVFLESGRVTTENIHVLTNLRTIYLFGSGR